MTNKIPRMVTPEPAIMPPTEKQALRAEIERETAEYLSRGNDIHHVDHTASPFYGEPAKRKRRDQVDYMKRFGADRSRD